MPTRRSQRIKDWEEEQQEEEWDYEEDSSSQPLSSYDEEDESTVNKVTPRRSRTVAEAAKERKQAQKTALQRLKTAREARSNKKPKKSESKNPLKSIFDDDDDDELGGAQPHTSNHKARKGTITPSSSENEDIALSNIRKSKRGQNAKASPGYIQRRKRRQSSVSFSPVKKRRIITNKGNKPSQLLQGHRDYVDHGDGGGGYSDISDFIASSSSESIDDDSEGESDDRDVEEQNKVGKLKIIDGDDDDEFVQPTSSTIPSEDDQLPEPIPPSTVVKRTTRLRKVGEVGRSPDEIKPTISVLLRKRPEKPRLTAAQRIQRAQIAAFNDEEEQKGIVLDEAEILSSSPSSSSSSSSSDDETQNIDSSSDLLEEASRSESTKEFDHPKALTKALDALGMANSFRHMTEKECFGLYLEYLLFCYVDRSYKEQVMQSEQHRAQYMHAVKKIEYGLIRARDTVHSEAWRSCDPGLLEAVEWLPKVESQWDTESFGFEEMDSEHCAACNRKKSHATRIIIFSGHPRLPPENESIWDETSKNRRYSDRFLLASPVYRRKNRRNLLTRRGFQLGFNEGRSELEDYEEEEFSKAAAKAQQRKKKGGQSQKQITKYLSKAYKLCDTYDPGSKYDTKSTAPTADLPFDPKQGPDENYQEKEFRVGYQCSARLMAYHALFHYKHRLMARLKQQMKIEIENLVAQGKALPAMENEEYTNLRERVAEAVSKDSQLRDLLFQNYQEHIALAQQYQFQQSELTAANMSRGKRDVHKVVDELMADLHYASEGEESSVVFGDEEMMKEEEASDGEEEEGESDEKEEEKDGVLHNGSAHRKTKQRLVVSDSEGEDE